MQTQGKGNVLILVLAFATCAPAYFQCKASYMYVYTCMCACVASEGGLVLWYICQNTNQTGYETKENWSPNTTVAKTLVIRLLCQEAFHFKSHKYFGFHLTFCVCSTCYNFKQFLPQTAESWSTRPKSTLVQSCAK
jgi:hypothetical protein